MPPGALFTAAVTPSEPLAAWPPGHCSSLPVPSFQSLGAVASRNFDRMSVLPELSERCTGRIGVFGSVVPALSAAIFGSFQVLIVPEKMPARTSGESLRLCTPGRLYVKTIAPAVIGVCTALLVLPAPVPVPQRASAAFCSSSFISESLPAKSTWLSLKDWMPAPEPVALYCTCAPGQAAP